MKKRDLAHIRNLCNSSDWKTHLPKIKKGESILFEVVPRKGESLGDACERISQRIGANWWSNEKKYGNETFFEFR